LEEDGLGTDVEQPRKEMKRQPKTNWLRGLQWAYFHGDPRGGGVTWHKKKK
jgi:hypothetical protein